MSVNIDPNKFSNQSNSVESGAKTRILNNDEQKLARQEPTKVTIEGDIFKRRGVQFTRMTENQLKNEKIDIKSLSLSSFSTSKDHDDPRVTIAFRDPENSENIIAYKLDKEAFAELKESFSENNFFNREDGIIRLNGAAEEYIAGWTLEIKDNRGYDKADINGNGVIEEEESGELLVGFDHELNYDYLEKKVVNISSFVGAKTYQKYSDTSDFSNTTDITSAQTLNFGNSVEKELSNTLKLDHDRDGVVTLKEGLNDYKVGDKSVEESLTQKVEIIHIDYLNRAKNLVLRADELVNRDNFNVQDIINAEDRRRMEEEFKNQAAQTMSTEEFRESMVELNKKTASLVGVDLLAVDIRG